MTITIEKIQTLAQKENYKSLLLDADPDWAVVQAYLHHDMYVLFADGQAAAEAVICPHHASPYLELKNIAVSPAFRRMGLARKLITFLLETYRGAAPGMCVGTADASDGPLALYRSCGFTDWYVEQGFFLKHYTAPIWEDNGRQCIDMIYLKYPYES